MAEHRHTHAPAAAGERTAVTDVAEVRVGILTCSDRGARGERADVSGPTIHNLVVDRLGGTVAQYKVVPDDRGAIEATLIEWVDATRLDLILTSGGTGFSPRDVTPEATRAVVEREAPALVQAMLFESLRITPYAMLTRATAGIRKRTLIINLPGNPKAVTENFDAIAEVLPHAVDVVRGIDTHGAGGGHRHAAVPDGAQAPAAHATPGAAPAVEQVQRQHGDQQPSAGDGERGEHRQHRPQRDAAAPPTPAAAPPGATRGIARGVGGPPC